jgi:AcrR family transcriptional regulator
MAKRPSDASTARERILVAAERVIAERGPAVPLREIALEAGQRNNSAVQYYFKDRDGLIAAVVEFRLASLESARLERLALLEAEGCADDLDELVAALAVPMFEITRKEGATHYARFLEQVREHPSIRELGPESCASVRIIVSRLERALLHLPPKLRALRLRALTTALFAWLADRERAIETGVLGARTEALARADVLQLLVALLVAPAPGDGGEPSSLRA